MCGLLLCIVTIVRANSESARPRPDRRHRRQNQRKAWNLRNQEPSVSFPFANCWEILDIGQNLSSSTKTSVYCPSKGILVGVVGYIVGRQNESNGRTIVGRGKLYSERENIENQWKNRRELLFVEDRDPSVENQTSSHSLYWKTQDIQWIASWISLVVLTMSIDFTYRRSVGVPENKLILHCPGAADTGSCLGIWSPHR